MKNLLLLFVLICLSSCNSPVSKAKHRKKKVEATATEQSIGNKSKTAPVQEKDKVKEVVYQIERPEAIGYWMTQYTKTSRDTAMFVSVMFPMIFKYDGSHVTLQPIFVIGGTPWSTPKWQSKDGYYRFKTTWRGDSLFYRSIWKEKEFLAVFSDSVFVKTDEYSPTKYNWIYNRIKSSKVPDYSKPVLKKRATFNYSLLD